MEAATWKCTFEKCGLTGSGTLPEECPDCTWPCELTQEGYAAAFRVSNLLHERARSVANLLGHGWSATIDLSDVQADRPNETFTVRWTSANCSRGCCGTSEHEESIPVRYLWTSDADILAEVEARKAAEAAAEAALKRRQALEDAETAADLARIRAATAQAEAQKALAAAEANLAALRGAR
jgi:hypothetical protein